MSWASQAETWLDRKGRFAWLAAITVAFIVFWPLGLALLFYIIWRKPMCARHWTSPRNTAKQGRFRSSGNTAFDAYKADTLKRLEDEQTAFHDFLRRLRDAKDQAEFDQFMSDRAAKANTGTQTPSGSS
jgi:hypothetical protein